MKPNIVPIPGLVEADFEVTSELADINTLIDQPLWKRLLFAINPNKYYRYCLDITSYGVVKAEETKPRRYTVTYTRQNETTILTKSGFEYTFDKNITIKENGLKIAENLTTITPE